MSDSGENTEIVYARESRNQFAI